MSTYSERLKDPRWQAKRLRIMERDGFACTRCGDKTSTLHVHHGYYERGRTPWDYEDETLWTLCESCHDTVAEFTAYIHNEIAKVPPKQLVETLWAAVVEMLNKERASEALAAARREAPAA